MAEDSGPGSKKNITLNERYLQSAIDVLLKSGEAMENSVLLFLLQYYSHR